MLPPLETLIPRKHILLVEDNAEMRRTLARTLELERYQVAEAEHGLAALNLLQQFTPDLIISDINMPAMSGIEFYQSIRQNPLWVVIPFIFLTANSAPEEIRWGRALGVEDYLTKPVDNADLLATVHGRLLRRAEVTVAQIGRAYLETVNVLANTIEGRDLYTHGHVERVARYARAFAEGLGWIADHLQTLEFGARLHDIGKISIPDQILNKPGKLTEAEWDIMRQHPVLGAKVLREITHLHGCLPYVLYHHERWDGLGYPKGLQGREIPIEGRLLAIVDVYDALTSERPYHPPRPHAEVLHYLQANAGKLFDPHLVPVFVRVMENLPQAALVSQDNI